MTRTRARRGAAAITMALAGAALVPLTAAPAGAAPGCTDETRPTIEIIPGVPIPAGDGCDDDTPPDTVVSAATAPNAAGFVNVSTMTFTVGARVSDGDA